MAKRMNIIKDLKLDKTDNLLIVVRNLDKILKRRFLEKDLKNIFDGI